MTSGTVFHVGKIKTIEVVGIKLPGIRGAFNGFLAVLSPRPRIRRGINLGFTP